jgi:epoxyqueuosine reductase QueG
LTADEEELIKRGGSVWGCDICQNVCPQNRGKKFTKVKELRDSAVHFIHESNVEELYQDRAFNYRSIDVIKRNLRLLESGK